VIPSLRYDLNFLPELQMIFTSHNIQLPDGQQTLPEVPLISAGSYCRAVLRTLRLMCPIRPGVAPRVADVGCLEGGFAAEFARAGYEVLGVEARKTNLEKCQFVSERLGLPNLSATVPRSGSRNVI
jgi:hypothetical protein